MRHHTKFAAVGILLGGALFTSTAHATTIGLTGGAPQGINGQTTVSQAGVQYMGWAGNQTPTNPLIPTLKLRVSLHDTLMLPAGLTAGLYSTQDEPWLNHVPASFTQAQVDVIHAADGTALTNQGWGSRAPTVAELAAYPGDILSVDSYPTVKHPYARIVRKVALLRRAAHGRPVWAVLQVCSRSNFAAHRAPSAAVEWEMARRALDNGASGIMFFGGGYQACFQSAQDRATGFNWSAWRSTILPTIRRIRSYR